MAERSFRIAILAADFNQSIVQPMIDAATAELQRAGAQILQLVRVTGCYESPLIADALLRVPSIDALVVLGYIERGETQHGEVMGHVVHRSLVELQLQHRKPVGIGIIGPGATIEQAEVRKISSATSAVRAVLTNLQHLRMLKEQKF